MYILDRRGKSFGLYRLTIKEISVLLLIKGLVFTRLKVLESLEAKTVRFRGDHNIIGAYCIMSSEIVKMS